MASGLRKGGLLVAFEGVNGAGKTGQVAALADWLRGHELEVVTTREPGGCPSAERIRGLLLSNEGASLGGMAEVLMFAAARAEHVEQVIAPALARGAIVLCDRFVGSTLAFQGYGQGVDVAAIRAIHHASVLCTPDLTVWLDLDWREGLRRAQGRQVGGTAASDRFEGLDADFQERVAGGFLTMFESGIEPWLRIDAAAPFQVVHERIVRGMADFCGIESLVA